MTTEEVEALAKVADTAFVMGGSGEWDDAIRADCEAAGVTRKLRDVAQAVARAVRAQDAARGGALSAETLTSYSVALEHPGPWSNERVLSLFLHSTTQGRTIAALQQAAKLGNALVELLMPHAGSGGDSEGAEECLSRLLREREELRSARDDWKRRAKTMEDASCQHHEWFRTEKERAERAETERDEARYESQEETEHKRLALRERDEACAQLAALTQERDEERGKANARNVRLSLDEERALRAELAEKDARIAELEATASRGRDEFHKHIAASARHTRTLDDAVRSSGSALATLRQAVGPFVTMATKVAKLAEVQRRDDSHVAWALRDGDGEAALRVGDFRALLAACVTPPPEYPDTGIPTDPITGLRSWCKHCKTPTGEHREICPLRMEHPDTATLRGIRERAKDADALGMAAGDYTAEEWKHISARERAQCMADSQGVAAYLLAYSGPSGGGEQVAAVPCLHSEFGAGVCTLPVGHAEPHQLHHGEPTTMTPSPVFCDYDAGEFAAKPQPTPPAAAASLTTLRGQVDNLKAQRAHTNPASEPTPEEDWRWLETHATGHDEDCIKKHPRSDDPCICGAKKAAEVLSRLRDEPRRAAEAMRERCQSEMGAFLRAVQSNPNGYLDGPGPFPTKVSAMDVASHVVLALTKRIRALPL